MAYTYTSTFIAGYASDGGLYVPESVPRLSPDEIRSWSGLGYVQLLKKILPLFIDDQEIPKDILDSLIDEGFKRFNISQVVKIARLNKDGDDKNPLNIAELFHGPTMTFKVADCSTLEHSLLNWKIIFERHFSGSGPVRGWSIVRILFG